MSFQAKNSAIQDRQLKVQELVIQHGSPLYEVSGGDVVIDIGENVKSVECCHLSDDSAGAIVVIPQADISISGSEITATVTIAANDRLILKYIVE